MAQSEVVAAGAVVTRKGRGVLLIHRPRYDDWSFPKGKADPGEHVLATAVREVAEETGLRVRLAAPLPDQRYRVSGRPKRVHYWVGRVVGDDDVSGFVANGEVDEVAWLPWDEARARLTYPYDRDTLDHAARVRKRSHALVVLRHAHARSRSGWTADDRLRPLAPDGVAQTEAIEPLLAAYDVSRVVSSGSTRCLDTVAPYAALEGLEVEARDELSEEGASASKVTALVDELLAEDEGTVVCTHRPVLPTVLDALGVARPGAGAGVDGRRAPPPRPRRGRRAARAAAALSVTSVSSTPARRRGWGRCSRRVHPARAGRSPALPSFAASTRRTPL